MILFYNAERVLSLVGIDGDAVVVARVAIVVLTGVITAASVRSKRRSQEVTTTEATEPALTV
jgi:hypothetical protein